MYIFGLSVLLVSIVGLCFFKSKFWANRYLILLIIAGVSFVATYVTNLSIRSKDNVVVELVKKKVIYPFSFTDSIKGVAEYANFEGCVLNDTLFYYDNVEIANDSVDNRTFVFASDSTDITKVYYVNRNKSLKYYYFDDVYIEPSESDTLSYIAVKKLKYNIKPNKWTSTRMPKIDAITCLYIPPSEYNTIPDSLIRKANF